LIGNVIHEVAVGARNKGYREKPNGATPVSFLAEFTGKSGENPAADGALTASIGRAWPRHVQR
jgi:hypothetical protein